MRFKVIEDKEINGQRFLLIEAADDTRVSRQEFPLTEEEMRLVTEDPTAIVGIAENYATELGATVERTQPLSPTPVVVHNEVPFISSSKILSNVPFRVEVQKSRLEAEKSNLEK